MEINENTKRIGKDYANEAKVCDRTEYEVGYGKDCKHCGFPYFSHDY